MHDNQIAEFWAWFTKNESKLRSHDYDPLLLKKLDSTICAWQLDWEVGPGKSTNYSLTISPRRDPEKLLLTERIIKHAPVLAQWEYYPAKQAKENWHLLELPGEKININASNWEYVLLIHEDGMIEILVKVDCFAEYDEDTNDFIVDLVLTNLLGEEIYMDRIDLIEAVDDFDSGKGGIKLKNLPEHLQDAKFS